MSAPEFEVFRDHLGVGATDVEVDEVSRLYDAILSEVRRLTHRGFEGDEGGTYDEVIRIDGSQEFRLPWTPVRAITSIARKWFDGTEDEAYDATSWRLENAETGLVSLRPSGVQRFPMHRPLGPEYVRVLWTTTGEIPAQVPQAILDWGKARWDERDQATGLAGYTTGDDSETYFMQLAGRPPRSVMAALMGVKHLVGGGKV
jgi:hypothetical protein